MPDSFDYIVVGSGAGGGVLASRLARNNRNLKVLLIEAGGHVDNNPHYQVPAFHPIATEDPQFRWDYFVDHFSNRTLAQQDEKWRLREQIFYPRASALGGCTTHHAMISVYPDLSDWDAIAQATGDASWASDRMWRYFLRCAHDRGYAWLPLDAAGLAILLEGAKDAKLRAILEVAIEAAPRQVPGLLNALRDAIDTLADGILDSVFDDTNGPRQIHGDREGLYRIPLSVKDGRRCGVTEFVLDTNHHPVYGPNLTIWTECLVTQVMLDGDRATGVQYLPRSRAYRADRGPNPGDQQSWDDAKQALMIAEARREVILAAGAFNSPQLLMLSGIGPADQLQTMGLPVRADLPGVGQNLQDRYEIPVIDEIDAEFAVLQDYPFDGDINDRGYQRWQRGKSGLYATNGGTIAIMKRSAMAPTSDCDLFIFGIPGEFAGYQLDYSKRPQTREGRSRFSWVILKAHTDNTGSVTLRTRDPRDPPNINFRNFGDGAKPNDPDLLALEEAVEFVRSFMHPLRNNGTTRREVLPGAALTGQQLRDFIRTRAWGHHASCTCAIGGDGDERAVLDGEFRVRDLPAGNLRVVDASVFPRIPGYFIVLPTYMIAEKPGDVILRAAGAQTMPI